MRTHRAEATLAAIGRRRRRAREMSADDDLSPSTPLDVRTGATKAADEAAPLRWGLLGAGNISHDWAKSLKDVPGATLAAVAARTMDKAVAFAEEHGIPNRYDRYAALVDDPTVDIVYVGTITPLHKEHTLLAIAAGKHVLCEKPLAESEADACEMFDAAAAKGVMLQEGMWTCAASSPQSPG